MIIVPSDRVKGGSPPDSPRHYVAQRTDWMGRGPWTTGGNPPVNPLGA